VQDRLLHSPLWKTLSGQVHLSVNSAFEVLAAARSAQNGHYII